MSEEAAPKKQVKRIRRKGNRKYKDSTFRMSYQEAANAAELAWIWQ